LYQLCSSSYFFSSKLFFFMILSTTLRWTVHRELRGIFQICNELYRLVDLWYLTPLSTIFQLQPVLLVQETEYPEKTIYMLQITDKLDHIMFFHIHLAIEGVLPYNAVIGTDCIGRCKSNYHDSPCTLYTCVLMKQQEITFHTSAFNNVHSSLFHWCQHQLLSVVQQNVMKVVLYHRCHTLKNIIIETYSVFELDLFKTKWPYLINSHEGRHFYFSYENKYTFPHNFKFQQCRLNNIRGKLKVSQRARERIYYLKSFGYSIPVT
jgi:hypothetical protein